MVEYKEKRDFHRMEIDRTAQFRINGSGEMNKAVVKDLSSGGSCSGSNSRWSLAVSSLLCCNRVLILPHPCTPRPR